MDKTKIDSILSISAPCFNCYDCYSCRYWQNTLWCEWILKNNECPVNKYQYGSLYLAILREKEKVKKEREESITTREGFFSSSY